jgi:hypothetical protein
LEEPEDFDGELTIDDAAKFIDFAGLVGAEKLLFKLDFQNAFDTVSWIFLSQILLLALHLIRNKECVHSSFLVLVSSL